MKARSLELRLEGELFARILDYSRTSQAKVLPRTEVKTRKADSQCVAMHLRMGKGRGMFFYV
jgi:hypothetical protein